MGFKSAKNTRNVNQSNGKYEVDDIIFPSRFVFSTIESIDRNLRFFIHERFLINCGRE